MHRHFFPLSLPFGISAAFAPILALSDRPVHLSNGPSTSVDWHESSILKRGARVDQDRLAAGGSTSKKLGFLPRREWLAMRTEAASPELLMRFARGSCLTFLLVVLSIVSAKKIKKRRRRMSSTLKSEPPARCPREARLATSNKPCARGTPQAAAACKFNSDIDRLALTLNSARAEELQRPSRVREKLSKPRNIETKAIVSMHARSAPGARKGRLVPTAVFDLHQRRNRPQATLPKWAMSSHYVAHLLSRFPLSGCAFVGVSSAD
jgi:hypothetical protein